jgi:hypothetical protein
MERLLIWTTVRLNRRTLVKRTLALAFGLFAGAAAGYPGVAVAADPCYIAGYGRCEACSCGPHATCQNCGTAIFCNRYTQMWPVTGCWNNGTHQCCDCACRADGFDYLCWCYDG